MKNLDIDSKKLNTCKKSAEKLIDAIRDASENFKDEESYKNTLELADIILKNLNDLQTRMEKNQ